MRGSLYFCSKMCGAPMREITDPSSKTEENIKKENARKFQWEMAWKLEKEMATMEPMKHKQHYKNRRA